MLGQMDMHRMGRWMEGTLDRLMDGINKGMDGCLDTDMDEYTYK